MPRAARLTPHSAAIPGDAKLIASTSNPSSALRRMHRMIAAIWGHRIGASSISRLMSVAGCIILFRYVPYRLLRHYCAHCQRKIMAGVAGGAIICAVRAPARN
jgi:hypothetical protein